MNTSFLCSLQIRVSLPSGLIEVSVLCNMQTICGKIYSFYLFIFFLSLWNDRRERPCGAAVCQIKGHSAVQSELEPAAPCCHCTLLQLWTRRLQLSHLMEGTGRDQRLWTSAEELRKEIKLTYNLMWTSKMNDFPLSFSVFKYLT